MITNVREDRLIVVSDVHLGSSLLPSNEPLRKFLDYVCENEFSLCINGDGLDILQTSVIKMTKELSAVFEHLEKVVRKQHSFYYVIGNHDIVLEHFIEDFKAVRLAPFLNVTSGGKRIRIEHGHLYDPFFVHHPDLYFFVTRVPGFLSRLRPMLHSLARMTRSARAAIGKLFSNTNDNQLQPIPGESPHFLGAAIELTRRGFDAVIFGHTHFHGSVKIDEDKAYFNTGSWFRHPHYARIEKGDVQLLPWKG